jgi:hypothetical protein
MNELHTRLRGLGYHQDLQGRWVHGGLALWLMDPDLLLQLPPEEVSAFHDSAIWADLRPAPRPLMEADLSRVINDLEMTWNGWLATWISPSSLQLTQADLTELGPQGLASLETQRLEWLEEHGRRRFAGCAGMGAMILWLGVGWAIAGSVTVWLIGMAVIAVGSWLMRPVPWPAELDPDPPNVEEALTVGREMLGPDWQQTSLLTSPIPVDTDHVHFLRLERTIAVDALLAHFTPGGFMRILHAVEPLDETEPESGPPAG